MKLLPGRTAVVTGAGGGLGAALAAALAARGMRVALADRDPDRLAETAASLAGARHLVSVHCIDVGDRSAMQALPEAVLAAHEAVHLLVNNAGVSLAGPAEETSVDDLEWALAANFWGVVHGCTAFLPHLRRAGEGHMVTVLSTFALVGCPGKSGYSASKFAARGYCEALQAELHGGPVGCTAVYPGPIATGIAASGRARDAGKQALEARFLARQGLPPARVAERVLCAVERREPRVLIGREPVALDLLQRLSPAAAAALMAQLRRRLPFL